VFGRVLFPTDFSPQVEQLAGCLTGMQPHPARSSRPTRYLASLLNE
jgi:hypothetical protein